MVLPSLLSIVFLESGLMGDLSKKIIFYQFEWLPIFLHEFHPLIVLKSDNYLPAYPVVMAFVLTHKRNFFILKSTKK